MAQGLCRVYTCTFICAHGHKGEVGLRLLASACTDACTHEGHVVSLTATTIGHGGLQEQVEVTVGKAMPRGA